MHCKVSPVICLKSPERPNCGSSISITQFLAAELTCNWKLHLASVVEMLNLFAATGHNNYARSARLYVQTMLQLEETHPTVHEMFDRHGLHSVRRTDKYWCGVSSDQTIEQTMMLSVKGRGGLTRGRAMTETVRSLWINTAHHMADIDMAMSSFLGTNSSDSEHVEVGKSRVLRDNRDMQTCLKWFDDNNPFNVTADKLRSLSTGVVANQCDGVNCDIAEDVGLDIQRKMDNKSFTEVKFSRSEQVRTLAYLTEKAANGKKENKKETNSLFHRLLILAERSAKVESYFCHELTTIPTALFKDDFMRKPNKPELAKCITKKVIAETSVIASPDSLFVLDGGSFLHKVRWFKDATFDTVFRQYSKHIFTQYGRNASIVFDGYASSASTKDHEHRRRANGLSCVPSQVDIQPSQRIVFDQHTFLASSVNKQSFIKHLMAHRVERGFTTKQSESDADTMIVSTALDLAAKLSGAVTVVAEDTDILVLLAHHLKDNMSDITLISETKKARKPVKKRVSIRALQKKLGVIVCQQLLTIHALGGCDTTSALYGVGKATVYKRIKNCHLKTQLETMQNSEADEKSVSDAGMMLMVCVYGGNDAFQQLLQDGVIIP